MVQMILYPLKLIVFIKKKVEKSFILMTIIEGKKKIFNIINETSNMKGSSTLDLKGLPYSFNLRIYLK
jgi:hypothetical protein